MYCKGWRRMSQRCRRTATPGFLTCTYHRHQEEWLQERVKEQDEAKPDH